EGGEGGGGGGMHSRAGGAGTQELVDVDGLSESRNRDGAAGSHLDESLSELQRAPREENGSRIREVLEVGGEVGGLSHRDVVHPEVVADRAHYHLSGIDPHADTGRGGGVTACRGDVPPHRFLDVRGGVARAHRVIPVSPG